MEPPRPLVHRRLRRHTGYKLIYKHVALSVKKSSAMTVTKLDLTKKRPVKSGKIFTHEIGTIEYL